MSVSLVFFAFFCGYSFIQFALGALFPFRPLSEARSGFRTGLKPVSRSQDMRGDRRCKARVRRGRAHLDTTTMPLVDSLSPRRRSGERVRERGFQLAAPIRMEGAPLPSPLPARASQGEGAGGFHDGGGIEKRPTRKRREIRA